MVMSTQRDLGQYVAAEASLAAIGRTYRRGVKRPVIYFTGANGLARDFLDEPASGSQIAPRLVDVGIPFISSQFGSPPLQWANDIAQARIGQLWTYVKTLLGPRTDKFVGIGVSKGAAALLNYARNNPANVAAIVGIVPAANINDLYVNQAATFQAQIDVAYPSGTYPPNGWPSAKGTHDPALNAATHAAQGIPMRFYYGDADTTVLPAVLESFMAAVGSSIQSQKIAGTDHLTTGPAIDPLDVLKFLDPYL